MDTFWNHAIPLSHWKRCKIILSCTYNYYTILIRDSLLMSFEGYLFYSGEIEAITIVNYNSLFIVRGDIRKIKFTNP